MGDASLCQTCSSTLVGTYAAFPTDQTSGPCAPTTDNNARYLMTVDHTTILGAGTVALDSVTYDGITENTATTALSAFLYTQKVIEFSAFTANNVVSFSFSGLPSKHEKVIVRARVYTECSTFSS
jgi:hypothetical protein